MADDKQGNTPASQTTSQDVERIRDIIFGPQMRDFESRFQMIQRDLNRLQQEIDRLVGQLTDQGGDQNKKLQNLRQEMRQADDNIRDELRQTNQRLTDEKVDRMALGELFVELGNHLKNGGSLAELLKGLGGNVE